MACGGQTVGEVASRCVDCHVEQAEAFASSPHASAGRSEVFLALREDDGCDTCHRPAEDGLVCVTCHAAVGNRHTSDGALLHDLLGGVQAPVDGGFGGPHFVDRSGFLEDAALCGTCHDATGPPAFVERPYLHWLESPAAAVGETCQDCHSGHDMAVSTDPIAWFSQVLDLGRDGDRVWVQHTGRGHRLPDGAAFLRQLEVVSDAFDEPWLLSPQPALDGVPVASPRLANGQVGAGLAPGERRERALPAGTGAIDVCVVYHRYAPGLLDELGLPEESGVAVLCEHL